jgi:dihydrolipoamide dehydrogenase
MPVEIKVPYLGHNVENATVGQWLKAVGDTVAENEIVLELEADKAVLEVEAPAGGVLAELLAPAGTLVKTDDRLGVIAAPGEKIQTSTAESKASATTAEKTPATTESRPAPATATAPKRVVVIGGGPGGYTAAIKAAQRGAKVTLVEKAKLGGTCLHTGCMPTKAYLARARVLDQLAAGAGIFSDAGGVKVDLKKLMAVKDKAVGNLTNGIKGLMKSNGIEVITGTATFAGPKQLDVQPEKGAARQIETDAIIIAAGSIPMTIPGVTVDGQRIHDTDTIWRLDTIPSHLLIAGSGAVGVEFACIYQALGTEVTIVEMLDLAMPGINREMADGLVKSLNRKGIKILTQTAIIKTESKDGQVMATLKRGDTESTKGFDAVLIACGRRPSSADLDLDKAGIRTEKGTISVDANLKTSADLVYAIGDVIGPPMLAHAAFYEADVAVANLFGEHRSVDYSKIPFCIYSFPEVGSIGLNEEQAARKSPDFKTARFPFVANGKAMVCGETDGMVKILYDEALGEILGVHIIGEHATELIATFATAMTGELTIDEIAATIMAHPTLSEAMAEAAQAALGRALHLPKPR